MTAEQTKTPRLKAFYFSGPITEGECAKNQAAFIANFGKWDGTISQMDDLAALIVKAVNNHAALVEALQKIADGVYEHEAMTFATKVLENLK